MWDGVAIESFLMMEVEVSLNNESQNFVTVPFFVTSENLEYPILALNTYQHHTKQMSSNISYQDVYQTIYQKCLIH